jgi:Ca2+-binding EF-hand superfamily protein
MVKEFARIMTSEAHDGPRPFEVKEFIKMFGKEQKGFLSYTEFKDDIYKIFVVPNLKNKTLPDESRLNALFNVIDGSAQGSISEADFVNTINRKKPAIGLIERLMAKIKKGGERFERALREELQEADAPFGCNGKLPMNVFQAILSDYDIHILESDQKALRLLDANSEENHIDYNLVLR